MKGARTFCTCPFFVIKSLKLAVADLIAQINPAYNEKKGDASQQQHNAQRHFPVVGAYFKPDDFLQIHNFKPTGHAAHQSWEEPFHPFISKSRAASSTLSLSPFL